MKIHNTSEYLEKLKIRPVNVNNISGDIVRKHHNNTDYLKAVDAKNKLEETIEQYCCYNFMGINNIPQKMGKLLALYGEKCDYRIRSFRWTVETNTILDEDEEYYILDVFWMTEGMINDRDAQTSLSKMFSTTIQLAEINLSGVDGFDIYMFCGYKGTYKLGGPNPDVAFCYNPDTREVDFCDGV